MMHEQLKVVPLSTGTLLSQPTARIDKVDPTSIPIPTAAAPQDVTLTGVNLDNPTGATFDDTNLAGAIQAGGTATQVTVRITPGAAAPTAGTKVLSLKTPQGTATAQLQVG
jgi:hypothetical protein